MRTAVISDVHGNIAALNAALKDARKQKCDRVVCLGDIVGYGYDPNGCARKIKVVCGGKCVVGNHDAAVVGKLSISWFNATAGAGVLRDRKKLTKNNRAFLDALPTEIEERPDDGRPCVCFTHGCINGDYDFPYVNSACEAVFAMDMMKMRGVKMLFVGHTHEALSFVKDCGSGCPTYVLVDKQPVHVDGVSPIIVNVGSVGYPRRQPNSIYAIYDDEEATVVWRVLPFDFKGYCANLMSRGIPTPRWMWNWVEEGLVTEQDAFGDKDKTPLP